jgi:hypothetical protein
MNTKITVSIFAIITATMLLSFAVVAGINQASAVNDDSKQGGPKAQKNFGQCKQVFNDNPCKKFHTGSG